MYNSVLQFIEKDIHEIEILVGEVIQGNKDTTDLSLDIQERMNNLGSKMISEIYELIDECFRFSNIYKKMIKTEKTIFQYISKIIDKESYSAYN